MSYLKFVDVVVRFVIGYSVILGGVLDKVIDEEDLEYKDFLRLKYIEGYY